MRAHLFTHRNLAILLVATSLLMARSDARVSADEAASDIRGVRTAHRVADFDSVPHAPPARRDRHVPQQSPGLVIQQQLGGSTDAVVTAGGRVYAGVGTRVVVLDASDAGHPRRLGETPMLEGSVMDLVVDGPVLYAALGPAGVAVVDVADAAQPRVVGRWRSGGSVSSRLALAGGRLYVVVGGPGVRILDVADRAQPREMGGFGQLVTSIAVKDNVVYSISRNLTTWDVSDPAHAVQVRFVEDWADAVRADGNTLFVGTSTAAGTAQRTAALRTYNIASAGNPIRLGEAPLAGQARAIVVTGGKASILAGTRLQTFDVGNPARPREDDSVPVLEATFGVAPIGTLAYLAAGGQGLRLLDRRSADGSGGARILNAPGRAEAVALDGDRLYIDDADERVLVYRPGALDAGPIGSFPASVLAGAMTADNGFVYTASADRKLHIFDARNAGDIREVATRTFGEQAQIQRIGVRNGYAYLAADPYLRVWDVANPAAAHQVFMYAPSGGATDLAVGDGVLYVTGPSTGLQRSLPSFKTIDLREPGHPRDLATLGAISFAGGIATRDGYVFIDDLQVVDACNPGAPSELTRLATPGRTKDIALDGDLLFVAKRTGEGGEVRLLDVSRPAVPVELFSVPTTASVDDIVARDGRFWAAARESGLLAGTGTGPAHALPTETPVSTPIALPTRMPGLNVGAFLPITWKPAPGRCR